MALDFTNNALGELPIYLDFTTRTEPTRMAGKKYVINNDTDEVIGIVGSKFNTVTHKEFFDKVCRTMSDCLLYTYPSPRDQRGSALPASG